MPHRKQRSRKKLRRCGAHAGAKRVLLGEFGSKFRKGMTVAMDTGYQKRGFDSMTGMLVQCFSIM